MRSSIKLLDDKTVNKIAAGEVIEKPASVVKELVENSIDAFSTDITIEIVEGGKKYIRVTDNGVGIEKNQVDLAFLRHSTSKISRIEDLQSITSLGFRGEALASIAAVSQLELITKVKEQLSGSKVIINGGKVLTKNDVGCPNGTTIIIRNLFYNVPVRQKFLKSDTVESSYISDIVYKLALGNPKISFKFIKDSKMIIRTPGKGDLSLNTYSLLGKEFINSMFNVNYEGKNIKISGLTCKPSYTRGNRNHQYLFVNNRYVRNVEISRAIEDVYKTLIPINRFPIFILYISIDPDVIDVNVHPTKTEIRFEDQNQINFLIQDVIKDVLNANNLIPEVSMNNKKEETNSEQSSFLDTPIIDYKKNDVCPEQKNNFLNEKDKNYKCKEFNHLGISTSKETLNSLHNNSIEADKSIRIIEYEVRESDETTKDNEHKNSRRDDINNRIPELNIIGKLFDTYILAENKTMNEFYLIDQHAAHERIMYEKLKHQLESQNVYTQQLLSAEVIDLTHGEIQLIHENIDIFKRIGFDIEEFGNNSIVLRSVPVIFGKPDSKQLLLDILDKLQYDIKSSYHVRLEKIMKMACTSAIKAGYNIKEIEINNLINELSYSEEPYTCPHGRPIIIKITKYELEKKFKRV
ncbi:DNA mismatch repair endonuclease MutL [Brassicibacter mesophilus]|uniref:DNA mismatch repair endonuclease MutL n=1 Tax=Brassicibacter mesophilus TaxID=745119 RepID=UPI003D22BE74